jgi:hypothetical protein
MGQQWLVWRRAPNTNRTNANANANVREAVSVLDPSRTWELARVKAGSDLVQYNNIIW